VAGDGDLARLERVLVLAMAAQLIPQYPAVLFDEFDSVSDSTTIIPRGNVPAVILDRAASIGWLPINSCQTA